MHLSEHTYVKFPVYFSQTPCADDRFIFPQYRKVMHGFVFPSSKPLFKAPNMIIAAGAGEWKKWVVDATSRVTLLMQRGKATNDNQSKCMRCTCSTPFTLQKVILKLFVINMNDKQPTNWNQDFSSGVLGILLLVILEANWLLYQLRKRLHAHNRHETIVFFSHTRSGSRNITLYALKQGHERETRGLYLLILNP